MNILVATEKPFAPIAVEGIRKVVEAEGWTLQLLEKYADKSLLLKAVETADALIVRSDKIDSEVFDAAGNLKIVVRAGAGYDNIDLAAATAHNVVVMNTPGQNSNAVAELAFGLLVYAVRNFYNGTSGTELKGKKLGLLAFGNVSKKMTHIAQGFGMTVYAYDAFNRNEVIDACGAIPVDSQKELFSTCDVVSLHIPLTPTTQHSINASLIGSMKQGGILLNTARKEIIDEADLLAVMKERTDLKYLADIKPDIDETLKESFPGRYFATPKKMGAQTAEANINAGIAAARQIVGFLKTGDKKFQVNK